MPVILDAHAMERSLNRMAHEIIERNPGHGSIGFIGIHTRGVPLAKRLSKLFNIFDAQRPPSLYGALDISFHRDDLASNIPIPKMTEVPFDLEGVKIILVDDVLFTGRTLRAALNATMDLGRPRGVELAVLVDRGHRQLPVRADYVGKNLPTAFEDKVSVHLLEVDGEDSVSMQRAGD